MTNDISEKVILIGSGALARDIVSVIGREFIVGTFVDPGFPLTPVEGLPVFTDWGEVRNSATHYLLGVLDRAHRQKTRLDARNAGLLPCTPMVHHTARVAHDARLAPGCLVGYYSVIGASAELLDDVLVMFSANVSHNTVIGENSVVLHGACVGGYTKVGGGCFIGANSSLAPNITIGCNSFIAAGASCFKDAPPDSMLLGNPARRSEMAKKG